MQYLEREISLIAPDIWKMVLGLDIVPLDSASLEAGGEATVTGCVCITGAWQGAVALQCPLVLALRLGAVMFDVDVSQMDREQAEDAVGELTNITSGSIKSILPESSHLSLPTVTEGTDYSIRLSGGCVRTRVTFNCLSWPVHVLVLQQNGSVN